MGYDGWKGFERRSESRIDQEFEKRPIIQNAHERALTVLHDDDIKLEEFSELYGEDVIKRDLATVERIKAKFSGPDRAKFASEIMEGIIFDQSERSDWLGPHAHTIKTSEFDDIVNGVDLVVEFDELRQARKFLALGVDATFGQRTIEKKYLRIKEEIDSGKLANIKYFRSQSANFMGQLSKVPRVVTGIDQEHLLELAGTWTQGMNKELGTHPAQRLVLAQIAQQLKTFGAYAERTGKTELVRPYQDAYATIRAISDTKRHIDVGPLREDKVHKEIVGQLAIFK